MKNESLFFTDKTNIGAQHVPIDSNKFAEGGLIAPNGKPSRLSPKLYEIVRTPEFKAWFGDWENDPKNASKVVDSNGEPLVVYHGTTENFTAFNTKSYFTDDYMNADGYANGEIVIEAFLIIKNPLIINAKGRKWNDLKSKYGGSTREIVGSLDHEKYDGVIFNSINDNWFDDEGEPQNVYNVNEPEQIKLADGTNTTFDPNNDDIRYAGGGNIDINEPFNVNGKTLAERVRILVKQLYPDYKWSVTSSYNKLDVYLLEADFDPFTAKWKEEHPDRELYYNVDDRDFEPYNRENNAKITDRAVEVFKPIRDYINKFVYNRNADDPYADYVDYNVYEYTYIGKWDKPYKQVEPKVGKKKPKAPVTPTVNTPPTKPPFKVGDILAFSQDKLNSFTGLWAKKSSSEFYFEITESVSPFEKKLIKYDDLNNTDVIVVETNEILDDYVKATIPLFKTGDTVVKKLSPNSPLKVTHRAYYQQIGVKYASLEKRFLLSGMSWHYELDNGSYAFENELELYEPTTTQTPNNIFSIQNIVSKTQWSEGLKKTMIEDFVNSGYENVTPLIGSDVRETSKNIENKVDGFSSGKNTYLQANMLAEEIHKLIDAGNSPLSPTTPTVENTFIDYLTANTEKANEISKELEVTSSLAMFLMGSKDIADLDSKKYAELMEEFLSKFPKLIEDESTNAN